MQQSASSARVSALRRDVKTKQVPNERLYSRLGDRCVLGLAQSGDMRACEHLLYKYRGLVAAKCRCYFMAGGDHEDLLQIGMIGLWQSIMDYSLDKPIPFPSFARMCIDRHLITAIKASTRHKQSPLNNSISLECFAEESGGDVNLGSLLVSDEELDPEELLIRREERRILREALKKMLSDFEWEVLEQYNTGKSYVQIAAALGCSRKSVDNALGRIKRKLSSRRGRRAVLAQ